MTGVEACGCGCSGNMHTPPDSPQTYTPIAVSQGFFEPPPGYGWYFPYFLLILQVIIFHILRRSRIQFNHVSESFQVEMTLFKICQPLALDAESQSFYLQAVVNPETHTHSLHRFDLNSSPMAMAAPVQTAPPPAKAQAQPATPPSTPPVPQHTTTTAQPQPSFSSPPYPPPVYCPAPQIPQSNFPGTLLPNHLGGTGTPFGYNFIFPQSVTVLHILKSSRPPWSSTPQSIEMVPCTVPTMITVAELMKSLGCDNKEKKKNRLYEITQGGNGKWSVGMIVDGSMDTVLGQTLKGVGWDEKRNGREEDFVWLFLTKD